MTTEEPELPSDGPRLTELTTYVLNSVAIVLQELRLREQVAPSSSYARFTDLGQSSGLDQAQLEMLTAVATAAAAAAISASRQRCPTKINGEYADIDEYFPTDTTPHHYRCNHSPPHCWDSNKQPLDPCPKL